MSETPPPPPSVAADTEHARAAAALVIDFFATVLGPAHETASLDRYLAPGFIDHDPATGDAGRSGVAEKLTGLWSVLPAAHYVLEGVVAAGDLVATTARLVSEQSPSGDPVDVRFADRYRVVDGRIVEHWHVVDTAALAAALSPAPGPRPR